MAMFILGWLLTGAIFSFGGMVIIRRWCNRYLSYGDLALAGSLSIMGPIIILIYMFAAFRELNNRLDRSDFWETPVFKKDR